jgi:cytochrome c biogenesis protein
VDTGPADNVPAGSAPTDSGQAGGGKNEASAETPTKDFIQSTAGSPESKKDQ